MTPAPSPDAVPKIHPATREMLPEDPMEMCACEVHGDPNLMLRLLVEEFARMGCDATTIVQLARDPNYQAFHGLWRYFGDEELVARVGQIVARSGVIRVKTKEKELPPAELVQIELG